MICIIFATFGIFVQLLDKNSLIVWFYASGFSETKSYYHTNDAEISKTHVSNMIQVQPAVLLTPLLFFINILIHPSILIRLSLSGSWEAGAYPNCHRAKGGVQPGQVANVTQG